MISIDEIIQSSIEPEIWEKLPAFEKLIIYNKLSEIAELINSHDSF